MNIYMERINCVRELMKNDGISWYYLTTADPHLSEYISDYYKEREFLTGFTGSNGNLLIGEKSAYLWTDGRYFVQAEKEVEGSGIEIMKMGQKGVPTLNAFLEQNLKSGEKLAFNAYLLSASTGADIERIALKKNCEIACDKDYSAQIWKDRPSDSAEDIYTLGLDVVGISAKEKLDKIREYLKNNNEDYLFLSKLDDIMWTYNIRGNDIECNPVCYSYSLIGLDTAVIYLKSESLNDNIRKYFKDINVEIEDYSSSGNLVNRLKAEDRVSISKADLNYILYKSLFDKVTVIEEDAPTSLYKAIKNPTEIKNLKKCYLDDSIVLCRFIKYLKENVAKNKFTESDLAEYLDSMRSKIDGFIELSFPTISAYGANAAMMHYEAVKGKDSQVKAEGIYLVDSGASYMNGTTDVTRSVILGNITDEMKMHFTLVAAGMLRLQNAVFMKGATGRNLDILARLPLWEKGIDYKCGTGHGVGYILNVHEGPQSIRTARRKGEEEALFTPGMIVSDEPGVYIAGSHGIRTENILLCEKDRENDDGEFYKFCPLTLVPIDLDGIDKSYLNSQDIINLNNYHKVVFDSLSPYLNDEEKQWLANATREI